MTIETGGGEKDLQEVLHDRFVERCSTWTSLACDQSRFYDRRYCCAGPGNWSQYSNFSVVNAVLLKPLGYPNADRLVAFMLTTPDEGEVPFASVPNFFLYQRQTRIFQDVGAFDLGGPGFNLTGGRPEQVPGLHVSEGYFRVFGAPVLLGRTFTQQEDRPHGGNVVVLFHD